MIVGRGPERAAIGAVLDAARGGRSAVLCLEGEPGIGKTTLLEAAERAATGFRCLRTTGVAADLELAHAALLEVLVPLREHLDAVPGPQRDALSTALGWSGAPAAGDRYLVAAATLSLLAAAAERQPVLLVVDDVQWVDRESLVALGFAARRLGADRVAVLLAGRDGTGPELAGLPRHRLAGLPPAEAAELLRGQVAATLVDPLVAATGGNPLALDEAVRRLTAEQRRGSAPLPEVLPVGERIAAAVAASLPQLTGGGRRALLLAAAAAEPEAGPGGGRAAGRGRRPGHRAGGRGGGRCAGGRRRHAGLHPPAGPGGGVAGGAAGRAPVRARGAGPGAGRLPGPGGPAPGARHHRVRRGAGGPAGGAGRPRPAPPGSRRGLGPAGAGGAAAPGGGPGRDRPGRRGRGRPARRRCRAGPGARRGGADRAGGRADPGPGAAQPRRPGAVRRVGAAVPGAAHRGGRGGRGPGPAAGAGRAGHGQLPARLSRSR